MTGGPGADAAGHRYRVLMTCGVFEPGWRGGGLVRAVATMVDTAPEAVDVQLVTTDRDLGAERPYPGLAGAWRERGRARIFYLDVRSPRQWWRVWRDLRSGPYDLIHLNSMFATLSVVFIVATRLGLIRGRHLMISPHGECAPGALALKAVKKRLYLRWLNVFLRGSDTRWHASDEVEAAQVAAVIRGARVTVHQNQTSLPARPRPVRASHGTPRLVFLGRIVEVKNVILALRALHAARLPVCLDLYGPIEDPGYWARCRSVVAELPAHVTVAYRGEVTHDEVLDVFNAYDAFVLPTRGENFGYAVAESLAASCPVMCSPHTPWSGVLRRGGGWVVPDLRPATWGEALTRYLTLTPDERTAARLAAGDAYRSWRRETVDHNIFQRLATTDVLVSGSANRP